DTADYQNAQTSITVDLGNPANNTGDAAGDTYISIENLLGGNVNDVLRGDANTNLLDGGLGGDVLDGGAGNDYAWYGSATAGVAASLATPASNTGDAAGDTYISIEGIVGSNFDDTLIGDANNNFLRGGLGADALDGGGGSDWAEYSNASTGIVADLL